MRSRGVSTTGFLISVAVIAIAASILYLINRSVLLNDDESGDIQKMRTIMGAIDLYESENNGYFPTQLSDIQRDTGDPKTFLSVNDPFSAGSNFPEDPAFPLSNNKSSFRISFTYLPQWIKNGQIKAKNMDSMFKDPRVGLLACYWYGDTTHLRADGLDASGPLVRINMDGSAKMLPPRKGGSLLTGWDLFQVK